MRLLQNNTWEKVTIQNGDMPGRIEFAQFLTHLDNLFIFGGKIDESPTDKCFVIGILLSEVEPIMNLEKPTWGHTLHHIVGMMKAYICGGRKTNCVYHKDILEFDILNQKFKTFGQLNTARHRSGVVNCHKYIWVFGGFDNNGLID